MTTLLVRTALLLALVSAQHCAADFAGVSFDSITKGDPLNLTWDDAGLDPASFPLVVALSLINETGSGVFGFKTNLSTSVNTTSYMWQGPPYPAPYLPTARYQVEVRSSQTDGPNGPSAVVARSPFFAIHQASPSPVSAPADTSKAPATASSPHGVLSKNESIAIGVVVGVFSVMALGTVGWFFRRRRRRATEEKRKRKRLDFIIS